MAPLQNSLFYGVFIISESFLKRIFMIFPCPVGFSVMGQDFKFRGLFIALIKPKNPQNVFFLVRGNQFIVFS